MLVEHFVGKNQCDTLEELERILQIRNPKNENEFILGGEQQYPYVTVTVKEDLATIHYMKDEGYAYIAVGGNSKVGSEGATAFHSCSETEEMTMDNAYVLDMDDAIRAAKEFFVTMKLPEGMKWEELWM